MTAMSTRRDGITSNVESTGDLEEILEEGGQFVRLEDLKLFENQPDRQHELIQSWTSEQQGILDEIANLLQAPQELLARTAQLLTTLKESQKDLNNCLIYMDAFKEELGSELYQALQDSIKKLQEQAQNLAQELSTQHPELAELLHDELFIPSPESPETEPDEHS